MEVKNLSKSQTQALLIFYTMDRIKYWEFHPKSILFIFEKKKKAKTWILHYGENQGSNPPFFLVVTIGFFFNFKIQIHPKFFFFFF